ncbi:MAG: helix-turn-helix transcriptional regulator [Solirubrobacteraceae bacterium]
MDDDTTDTTDAVRDQVILGRALRVLRDRAGLTQDELAERIGIDLTYVSRVERGKRGVRWHTVMRFLRALDMRLRDLTTAIENGDTDPPETR